MERRIIGPAICLNEEKCIEFLQESLKDMIPEMMLRRIFSRGGGGNSRAAPICLILSQNSPSFAWPLVCRHGRVDSSIAPVFQEG